MCKPPFDTPLMWHSLCFSRASNEAPKPGLTAARTAAVDLAVVFFEYFSNAYLGKFPAAVPWTGADGTSQTERPDKLGQ